MHSHVRDHGRTTFGRAVRITVVALFGAAAGAHAAPVAVGGGFDYYADSHDQVTRAALAIGALSMGGTDAFVVATRFDNNVVGAGAGVTGGIGLPVAPLLQFRLTGSRFIGDGDYRAWRLKAGPQLRAPAARVGVYYTHEDAGTAPGADGVVAEGDVPLPHGVGVRATAGYAHAAGGGAGALGSIGTSWSALRRVTLSAEFGLSRSGAIGSTTVPGAHRPTDGLPIIGGHAAPATTSTTTNDRTASVLLGARVSFP